MKEFEDLRARVEMLAGEAVQDLVRQWDFYLVNDITLRYLGETNDAKDPYKKLIQAMRSEIEEADVGE
jgi:hypothetical protein